MRKVTLSPLVLFMCEVIDTPKYPIKNPDSYLPNQHKNNHRKDADDDWNSNHFIALPLPINFKLNVRDARSRPALICYLEGRLPDPAKTLSF